MTKNKFHTHWWKMSIQQLESVWRKLNKVPDAKEINDMLEEVIEKLAVINGNVKFSNVTQQEWLVRKSVADLNKVDRVLSNLSMSGEARRALAKAIDKVKQIDWEIDVPVEADDWLSV